MKNVKKDGRVYPIAWDLARMLSESLTLKDERIWCQDNKRIAPYGMSTACSFAISKAVTPEKPV